MLFVDGFVEYSLIPWRGKPKPFHENPLYKWLRSLVHKLVYTDKEKQRLEEECEEVALYIIDRLREVQGSFPSIGRSKREFYQPYFRD